MSIPIPNGLKLKHKVEVENPKDNWKIVTITLYTGKVEIGSLILENGWYDGKYHFSHSDLESEYRGQGLGIYLYSLGADYCLANGLKMHSCANCSKEALRVWQSKRFRKYYRIWKNRHPDGKLWYKVVGKK